MSEVSFVTLRRTNYRGKKAKIGGLVRIGEGVLGVFLTYCESCNGKVCVPLHDARTLANKYRQQKKKISVRMLETLINRLDK